MEICYYAQPQMLLETVELLYAFVNDIPARRLTGNGPYCIPADRIQQMLDVACADLDRHDALLRFFFEKETITDDSGNETCVARNLIYAPYVLSDGDLHEHLCQAREVWRFLRHSQVRFTSVGPYGIALGVPGDPGFAPLVRSVEQLLVSPYYRQKLLEAFAGFDLYTEQLEELLLPVARRLKPLLEPWVQQAEPLAEAWRSIFAGTDLKEMLQKRWRISSENDYSQISFALRYLDAGNAPGRLDGHTNTAHFHIGLAFSMGDRQVSEPEEWEVKALRLLGNPARLKMLQAMIKQPMSSREMAQQLGLHLGTVCRDVSSLFDAKLLAVDLQDGRTRYRTNPVALDALIKRLNSLKPEN